MLDHIISNVTSHHESSKDCLKFLLPVLKHLKNGGLCLYDKYSDFGKKAIQYVKDKKPPINSSILNVNYSHDLKHDSRSYVYFMINSLNFLQIEYCYRRRLRF